MIDQVLSARYKLVGLLGTGGMARVFQAQDVRLGRMVAVKILHPQYAADASFLRRFDQEARLAAGLSHPNLVSVYDVGQDGDLHYIVMEYVPGETLKDLITRRGGPLPLDQALEIAIQVCSALHAAHQRGMVHRDVKSQNILIARPNQPATPGGAPLDRYGATRTVNRQPAAATATVNLGEGPVVVKVADFGIAHEMMGPSFTTTGMVMGSVHYFSPEQARGQPATVRSDLYAVGIVLYEMLTGRLPFEADNQMAVAMQQIQQTPLPPSRLNPALPAAVEAVVLKALAKNPDMRYASAPEMMQALAAVRRGAAALTAAAPRREATAPTTVVPRTPPPMASAAGGGSPPRITGPVAAPSGAALPAPGRTRAGDPTRSVLAGVVIGLGALLLLLLGAYVLLARTNLGVPGSGGGGVTETPTTASTATAAPTATRVPHTATAVPNSPTSRPVVAVPTETGAPTETAPPTETPTAGLLATATAAATATPSPTETALPPTETAVPSETPSPPTETAVPSDTPTPRPSHTAIPAPTETPLPADTPTPLPSDTVTPTETPLPSETPTARPSPTSTPRPSDTATPTETALPPTETPPPTETAVPSDTPTPPTETPIPSDTPPPTETPVPSDTPAAPETDTPSAALTETPVPGDTAVPSDTSILTALPGDTAVPSDTSILTVPGDTPVPLDTAAPAP